MWLTLLRILLFIQGLFYHLASLFVIFISGGCLSSWLLIKLESIPRKVFSLKSIQIQYFSGSFKSFCFTFFFYVICRCIPIKLWNWWNCPRLPDIGLVRLPAITFASVLLSKILSIRVFIWVLSLAVEVNFGVKEIKYIFSRKFWFNNLFDSEADLNYSHSIA